MAILLVSCRGLRWIRRGRQTTQPVGSAARGGSRSPAALPRGPNGRHAPPPTREADAGARRRNRSGPPRGVDRGPRLRYHAFPMADPPKLQPWRPTQERLPPPIIQLMTTLNVWAYRLTGGWLGGTFRGGGPGCPPPTHATQTQHP